MKRHHKIIGVIPARYDSQRLPGKVLLEIGEKSMIRWVYERAKECRLLSCLYVATDSDKVERHCEEHKIPVLRTGVHASGTDRLYEVMQRTDADVYVNIQGDEPTVRADHIELLVQPIIEGDAEVSTLKVAIGAAEAKDPNVVKVVTDLRGRALYFSRLPIPYVRDPQNEIRYYKHIGLYGYTRSALELFHGLPQSQLELTEKLEQLRYLENGIPIVVSETLHDTIGVDTGADLQKAAAFLSGQPALR